LARRFLLGCWFFCSRPRPGRGQMFEVNAEAEAKILASRPCGILEEFYIFVVGWWLLDEKISDCPQIIQPPQPPGYCMDTVATAAADDDDDEDDVIMQCKWSEAPNSDSGISCNRPRHTHSADISDCSAVAGRSRLGQASRPPGTNICRGQRGLGPRAPRFRQTSFPVGIGRCFHFQTSHDDKSPVFSAAPGLQLAFWSLMFCY